MADTATVHSLSLRRTRPEPLWREVLGRELRDVRTAQGETLTGTAARAGVSPQYLSEIERGLKDPSSEMISAIAGALGTSLVELTSRVAEEMRPADGAVLLLAA